MSCDIPTFDYDTQFHKGWPDRGLWLDFLQAMHEKRVFEVDCIIRAQGSQRPPVDARAFVTRSPDDDLKITEAVEFDAVNTKAELDLLQELSMHRDIPLKGLVGKSLTDNKAVHKALTEVSFFNQQIMVDKYPSKNFLDSPKDYEEIQAGVKPKKIETDKKTSILTGRDMAAWVHTDNPLVNWMPVVDWLIDNKVQMRDEYGVTGERMDQPFATWGKPYFYGLLGKVLWRAGLVSFHNKWMTLRQRPEAEAYMRGRILSQVFPEGSPMHPSHGAMHAIVAYALAYLLKLLFDQYMTMPSGNTLAYELDLTAENNSYGRLWAGVHFQSDNEFIKPVAKKLGQRVVDSVLSAPMECLFCRPLNPTTW